MGNTTKSELRCHRDYTTQKQKPRHSRKKYRDSAQGPVAPNLAIVAPVALNRLNPGTVVWAHIPFVDNDGEKTRPAVVVAVRGREVELLPVTSSERRLHFPTTNIELTGLREAGLLRACAVRLSPVVVDRLELINVSGALAEADVQRVFGVPTETDVA